MQDTTVMLYKLCIFFPYAAMNHMLIHLTNLYLLSLFLMVWDLVTTFQKHQPANKEPSLLLLGRKELNKSEEQKGTRGK